MSKTIEFVKKEIENTKKKLERLEIDLNFPFRKDVIVHLKEELKTLQQIKADLEAWEVVKGVLRLDVETDKDIKEGFSMPSNYWVIIEDWMKRYINVDKEQYEIIKKAMEVE